MLTAATPHAPWGGAERVEAVSRMRDQASTAGVDFSVVLDPPGVETLSPRKRSPWLNHRRAWVAGLRGEGTHHIVFEDDVELADHFFEAVITAIEGGPPVPMTFFVGTGAAEAAVQRARARGESWIVAPGPVLWAQALCLPHEWIEDYLACCDRWFPSRYRYPDTRFGIWVMFRRRPVWATVPVLVEHIEEKSLWGAVKIFRAFEPDLSDARRHDWSRPAKPVVAASQWSLRTAVTQAEQQGLLLSGFNEVIEALL